MNTEMRPRGTHIRLHPNWPKAPEPLEVTEDLSLGSAPHPPWSVLMQLQQVSVKVSQETKGPLKQHNRGKLQNGTIHTAVRSLMEPNEGHPVAYGRGSLGHSGEGQSGHQTQSKPLKSKEAGVHMGHHAVTRPVDGGDSPGSELQGLPCQAPGQSHQPVCPARASREGCLDVPL